MFFLFFYFPDFIKHSLKSILGDLKKAMRKNKILKNYWRDYNSLIPPPVSNWIVTIEIKFQRGWVHYYATLYKSINLLMENSNFVDDNCAITNNAQIWKIKKQLQNCDFDILPK